MRALFDNPALLLVGVGMPLLLGVVVLLAVYWVVRLAVRHGARDAGGARLEQRAPDDRSGSGG